MALVYPFDLWEMVGTGATWGTDVLEITTGNTIGQYAIKVTGNTPTSDFGLKNTVKGMTPVEGTKTYRLTAVVKASSVAGGRTVNIGCRIWTNADKTGLTRTAYILNNAVLPVAGTWVTLAVEITLTDINGRFAELFFDKDDVNAFDFEVDYFVIKREPVSFHAFLSADQSLITGGYRLIEFDAEETLASGNAHDVGGNFSTVTHLFTAPYTAMYHFDTNVQINDLGDGRYASLKFYKNGATYKQGLRTAQGSRPLGVVNLCVNGSIMVELDRGDTFSVYVFHNHGANRNAMGVGDGEESWFSGFEVSR